MVVLRLSQRETFLFRIHLDYQLAIEIGGFRKRFWRNRNPKVYRPLFEIVECYTRDDKYPQARLAVSVFSILWEALCYGKRDFVIFVDEECGCVIYSGIQFLISFAWWRHQKEIFSALLAICAGNSPVPVNSPHKGQWRGALMFSLICVWINNREAGDWRRYRAHNDVIVMRE